MSTTTKNLGLIKPDLTDPADITATNENWDKIEEAFGNVISADGGTMRGDLNVKGIGAIEPIIHDIGSPQIPFGSVHAKHYNIYSHPDKECGEISVHITGTTSRDGEAVLSAGNDIPSGEEGNSRGRVRLYGTKSGYIDVISSNEGDENYEILVPSGNGTLALEGAVSKIVRGSYVGTGTCGVDGQNVLTFDRPVKMLIIMPGQNGTSNRYYYSPSNSNYAYGSDVPLFLFGTNYKASVDSDNHVVVVERFDTTVSWRATADTYDIQRRYQRNESGLTYEYIAFM